jgi:pimeloyl-ACP methyl ester carboxylesterase
MRRAAVGLVVVAMLVVVQQAAPGRDPARPPQLTTSERCLNRVERRLTLRFGAADGTRLVGVLLGKGPHGVVLAHQSSGNLCQWFPYARMLARSGFRVLAFDFRTCGASDIPRKQENARRFDLDMISAVNVLRRRGAKSVALAGGSLGAGVALIVAARLEPRVQGVVSLSSPELLYDMDVGASARQLQVPVLFVAADDDPSFAGDARSLYRLTAEDDKQLLVLPQGGHGTSLSRIPFVRDTLTRFFRAHA